MGRHFCYNLHVTSLIISETEEKNSGMWEGERAKERKKKYKGREGGRKKKKEKVAGLRKARPQRVYNSYSDVDNSRKLIVFPL